MKIPRFHLFVLPVLFCTFANALALQQLAQPKPVKVPGTRVSLVPPAGLKPSERFPGFWDEEATSIMVTEAPGPYSEIAKAFTKENMATRGLNLLSKKEISLDGKPGFLMYVKQDTRSITFLKWMAVTGHGNEMLMITATFPEEMKDRWSSEMVSAVLSVKWEREEKIDPLAGLNFTFKADPSLKFTRRLSNSVILEKNGDLPSKKSNDPFFIIGSSISEVTIPDVKEFAKVRLNQITQILGPVIKKHSDVAIAGLLGSEIIAEAQWKDSPDKVSVYQVLLLDGKNYILMQGFAPQEEREKYLEIFNRVAQSFQKK